jgi:hypothetical protein
MDDGFYEKRDFKLSEHWQPKASGLHKTVRKLRGKTGKRRGHAIENDPSAWAPFVYIELNGQLKCI